MNFQFHVKAELNEQNKEIEKLARKLSEAEAENKEVRVAIIIYNLTSLSW